MNNAKIKCKINTKQKKYMIVITSAHPFAQETIPEKYND